MDFVALQNYPVFRGQHFVRVMNFLAQRQDNTPTWLSNMFFATHPFQEPTTTHPKTTTDDNNTMSSSSNIQQSLIQTSESFAAFWASWECARYCILNRLRTPFGSPVNVR